MEIVACCIIQSFTSWHERKLGKRWSSSSPFFASLLSHAAASEEWILICCLRFFSLSEPRFWWTASKVKNKTDVFMAHGEKFIQISNSRFLKCSFFSLHFCSKNSFTLVVNFPGLRLIAKWARSSYFGLVYIYWFSWLLEGSFDHHHFITFCSLLNALGWKGANFPIKRLIEDSRFHFSPLRAGKCSRRWSIACRASIPPPSTFSSWTSSRLTTSDINFTTGNNLFFAFFLRRGVFFNVLLSVDG